MLPPRGLEVQVAFPLMGEVALSVLRQIPDRASSKLLARLYSSFYGGWNWLSGQRLNESLWTAFGPTALDREPRDEEQLRRMSLAVCRNGAVSLAEDLDTDAQAWFDGYSGPNLRWESLGLLFIFWAGGARRLPERSAICGDCAVLHRAHPSQLVRQYKAAAWKCIELCREAASSNMLLAFLVLGHSLLESNISGDAGKKEGCLLLPLMTPPPFRYDMMIPFICSLSSLPTYLGMQYWRTHGDLMALTTYLGLHASPGADPMDCSVTAQVKRQLFAAIFTHDKVTATFTGRPAFLSRRFSSTPLPLDMSDEMLFSSNSPSADYRDCRVDENGWSMDGKLYTTTTLRARAMLAYVRDEILEIALQSMDSGGRLALL
jgi:hypothetical protein